MNIDEQNHHTAKSIESFLNLNGILRHDIINSLNIISLASDLLEKGNIDNSLLDMMKMSSSNLLNQLVQARELDRVLDIINDKHVPEHIGEILETTRRKYFSQCELITNLKENFLLSNAFSSIFNGLIRNATNYRKAKVITVSTANFNHIQTIIVHDDGNQIPDDIKNAINSEVDQFDVLKHEKIYFELFLVKEILKTMKNYQLTLENHIGNGNQFIITFRDKNLNKLKKY